MFLRKRERHDEIGDDASMARGAFGGSPEQGQQNTGYEPARDHPMRERNGYAAMARERADQGIDRAAERVAGMAGRIREEADVRGGLTADAGYRVAGGMERTATYLRQHDSRDIASDVERYVREHPLQALGGAALGGFVLARILR